MDAVRRTNPVGTADGADDRRGVPAGVIASLVAQADAEPVDAASEGFAAVAHARFVPGPFLEGSAADEWVAAATYGFVL
jgi:hypothetical protein